MIGCQASIGAQVPGSCCLWALHSQGVAGTHSLAQGAGGSNITRNTRLWCCLPPVHQAQLALILQGPVHLPVGSQSDQVWVPATPRSGFPVPLSKEMRGSNTDAGLQGFDAASLTPTPGASMTMCSASVVHRRAPPVPTKATPPGCYNVAACCHSLRCPFSNCLPIPHCCHFWLIVGQVITGANCSASLVGAAGANG